MFHNCPTNSIFVNNNSKKYRHFDIVNFKKYCKYNALLI